MVEDLLMKKIDINENEDITVVLSLFPPGEHDWYEVKGCREIDFTLPNFNPKWQEDLSKAISALSNSGGGYLILGAIESMKTITLDGDGINRRIKQNGTKKWLEDFLHTLTDPFIQGMNVYEFAKFQGNQLPETALYIVEIDDSTIAPHQAKDHKYYVRIGSSSKPANNQIVLDILGRQKYPELKVIFTYGFVNRTDPNYLLREGEQFVLIVNIENVGRVYAKYVNIILEIPQYLCHRGYIDHFDIPVFEKNYVKYARFIRENVITESKSLDEQIIGRNPGRFDPILPGRNQGFSIPLADDFERQSVYFVRNNPEIHWSLFADNMPKLSEKISMNAIKIDQTLPFSK